MSVLWPEKPCCKLWCKIVVVVSGLVCEARDSRPRAKNVFWPIPPSRRPRSLGRRLTLKSKEYLYLRCRASGARREGKGRGEVEWERRAIGGGRARGSRAPPVRPPLRERDAGPEPRAPLGPAPEGRRGGRAHVVIYKYPYDERISSWMARPFKCRFLSVFSSRGATKSSRSSA